MIKSSRRGKGLEANGPLGDDSDSFDHQEDGAGVGNGSVPDWRSEMRQEIRAAISETLGERPLRMAAGPSEIDVQDVCDKDQLAELKQKIEVNNAANKTAIRLANITKEGNKQHFLDMIEIKEEIDKAKFSIQGSTVIYKLILSRL